MTFPSRPPRKHCDRAADAGLNKLEIEIYERRVCKKPRPGSTLECCFFPTVISNTIRLRPTAWNSAVSRCWIGATRRRLTEPTCPDRQRLLAEQRAAAAVADRPADLDAAFVAAGLALDRQHDLVAGCGGERRRAAASRSGPNACAARTGSSTARRPARACSPTRARNRKSRALRAAAMRRGRRAGSRSGRESRASPTRRPPRRGDRSGSIANTYMLLRVMRSASDQSSPKPTSRQVRRSRSKRSAVTGATHCAIDAGISVPPGREESLRVAQRLEHVFLVGEVAENLGDDDVDARRIGDVERALGHEVEPFDPVARGDDFGKPESAALGRTTKPRERRARERRTRARRCRRRCPRRCWCRARSRVSAPRETLRGERDRPACVDGIRSTCRERLMRHRVDDVVQERAHRDGRELLRIRRRVGVLDGVAQVHVVADGHHHAPFVVVDAAPMRVETVLLERPAAVDELIGRESARVPRDPRTCGRSDRRRAGRRSADPETRAACSRRRSSILASRGNRRPSGSRRAASTRAAAPPASPSSPTGRLRRHRATAN